jgi:hypothetical protein
VCHDQPTVGALEQAVPVLQSSTASAKQWHIYGYYISFAIIMRGFQHDNVLKIEHAHDKRGHGAHIMASFRGQPV